MTIVVANDCTVAFIVKARAVAFHSGGEGSWRLYERLKAMAQAELPDLTPQEYERLMVKLARIAGV